MVSVLMVAVLPLISFPPERRIARDVSAFRREERMESEMERPFQREHRHRPGGDVEGVEHQEAALPYFGVEALADPRSPAGRVRREGGLAAQIVARRGLPDVRPF